MSSITRAVSFFLFPLLLAHAQTPPPAPASTTTDPLNRATPYGTIVGFLRAAAAHDTQRAAEYLDLRDTLEPKEDLVRQLNDALNQGFSEDLNQISHSPEGDLADGFLPDRERVGYVDAPSGRVSIDLVRIARQNQNAVWLFSSETLRNIPGITPNSPGSEITSHLPRWLVDTEFLSVPIWRWLLILLSIPLTILLSSVLTRALVPLAQPLLQRLTGHQDVSRFLALGRPIRLLVLAALIRLIAEFSFSLLSRKLWTDIAYLLAVGGATWFVVQSTVIVVQMRILRLEGIHQTGRVAILILGRRLLNILVVMAAVGLLLRHAGVNLTALVAGLGVGGVALALAAQKTLENVFGGISLITRDIIRPGDLCTMAGETGFVEDIGLGATLLRTLDRTMVSVPNAELSQKNLENISRRDKFWFHQVFGLRYDTAAAQIRSILGGIEGVLKHEARVEETGSHVRFIGFGESSLTLEIFAYVAVPDYDTFLNIQQKLLLAILEVITSAGASIASPAVLTDIKTPAHAAPAPPNSNDA